MKKFVIILGIFLITGCGAKNPTIRNDVKKRVNDTLIVGVTQYTTGNYKSSEDFLNDALTYAQSIDNIPGQIIVLINFGELYIIQRNYSVASNYIFTAKRMSELTKTTTYNFNLAITLGKYYSKIEDYDNSIRYYNEGLRYAKKSTDKAIVENNLGKIYMEKKDYSRALDHLNSAKLINEWNKVYDQLGINNYNIAEIYSRQKKYGDAERMLKEALKNDKISENSYGIYSDLRHLAIVSSKLNKKAQALQYIERAEKVAISLKNEKLIAEIAETRKELNE